MKKKIFALGIAFVALAGTVKAQQQFEYRPFRIDAGPFVVATFSGIGFGAGIGVEPKFTLYKNLSLGVRFDVHTGSQRVAEESVSMQGKNIYVTADWHFSSDTYRPFLGVGAGMLTSILDHSTGTSYSDMPVIIVRTGFDIPHLRVGVQTNITGNYKSASQTFNGSTIGIFVNVGIGGGKKSVDND
jgi:hypothetical protein